jgi:hypothetical protein
MPFPNTGSLEILFGTETCLYRKARIDRHISEHVQIKVIIQKGNTAETPVF